MTHKEIRELLKTKSYAVIHIDTDWDNYRLEVEEKINSIKENFINDVAFGYVDCDIESDYSKEIGLLNTPSIAYYNCDKLIAVVIGKGQDIKKNIEVVMSGGTPDTSNGISRF